MKKQKDTKLFSYTVEFGESGSQIVNGRIGFFCHHCFSPLIEKVKEFQTFRDNNYSFKHVVYEHWYKVYCNKCNGVSYWSEFLDPNITKAIALLNRKGYETKFSCEGHSPERFAGDDAYVLFKNDIFKNSSIPKPNFWTISDNNTYVDFEELQQGSVVRHEATCIRCSLSVSLENRIKSLEEWSKALPNIRKKG